jgi:hypothetical protein
MTSAEIQKYQKMSVPTLTRLAVLHFNAFIRRRDSDGDYFTCISCSQTKPMNMCNAGHYLSGGKHSATRFDEDNVNGQCVKCNLYEHGALLGYRNGLIAKIGLEAVEALELRGKMKARKVERMDLISIIIKYKGRKF